MSDNELLDSYESGKSGEQYTPDTDSSDDPFFTPIEFWTME